MFPIALLHARDLTRTAVIGAGAGDPAGARSAAGPAHPDRLGARRVLARRAAPAPKAARRGSPAQLGRYIRAL